MMKNNEIKEILNNLYNKPLCPLNYNKDYELLLAVMLSAQTTDDRVNIVTKELFKYDIYELSKLDENKIESIIKSLGMSSKKSHYIKEICKNLIKDYNGVVPNNRKYLESLPGIGHKSCNVVLSELFKVPSFAVDTHVSRVANRLGLTSSKDVNIIEKDLCNYFNKEDWRILHIQFVLFGRNICTSKNPKCDKCPLKNQCKNT